MQKDLFRQEGKDDPGETLQRENEHVLFGSCSFSEPDWVGPFYPPGTAPADYLPFYATRYRTVEIDATYYAVPSKRTVEGWREKTPEGFLFSAKFPRDVVHGGEGPKTDPEKILDSERALAVTDSFLESMSRLGDKLGPLLIQFPYFNKSAFPEPDPFLERLDRFLGRLPAGRRFAVELRNKGWLSEKLVDVLRSHGCVLALVDHAWMPHGAEVAEQYGVLTNGLGYIRLVGDRVEIEKVTKKWNREVFDQSENIGRWARLIAQSSVNAEKIVVYVNNHFAGYSPSTLKRLMELYYKEISGLK